MRNDPRFQKMLANAARQVIVQKLFHENSGKSLTFSVEKAVLAPGQTL